MAQLWFENLIRKDVNLRRSQFQIRSIFSRVL